MLIVNATRALPPTLCCIYKEKLPSFTGGAFHENLMEHYVKIPYLPSRRLWRITCKYSTEYDDLKNEWKKEELFMKI